MVGQVDDSHDKLAEIYDKWIVGLPDDTDQVVEFIAELADRITPDSARPSLLELGVGSGRVALPLSAKGFDVTGIDGSEPMLDLLQAKEGADRITVVSGDFTELDITGRFNVVIVVYNTLYSLPTQEDQVRCLRSVAARLHPGGALVVQAFVPDIARFDRGAQSDRYKELARAGSSTLRLRVVEHDRVRQFLDTEYALDDGGERVYRFHFRYIWPTELDLMAALGGLALENRWGGWQGQPFTGDSTLHVSVFRKLGKEKIRYGHQPGSGLESQKKRAFP